MKTSNRVAPGTQLSRLAIDTLQCLRKAHWNSHTHLMQAMSIVHTEILQDHIALHQICIMMAPKVNCIESELQEAYP